MVSRLMTRLTHVLVDTPLAHFHEHCIKPSPVRIFVSLETFYVHEDMQLTPGSSRVLGFVVDLFKSLKCIY